MLKETGDNDGRQIHKMEIKIHVNHDNMTVYIISLTLDESKSQNIFQFKII